MKIQGRGAERNLIHSSRRPQRRPSERRHERAGFKPDRVAMWAVLLGVLLILVAATSSHAARPLTAGVASHPRRSRRPFAADPDRRPRGSSAAGAAAHDHPCA